MSASSVKARIRQEFEANKFKRNLKEIDVLLFKGRIEYEETMNFWKQKTHVMRFRLTLGTFSKIRMLKYPFLGSWANSSHDVW